MRMIQDRVVVIALFLLPVPLLAQAPVNERIGPYVIDARGAFPGFKAIPSVAVMQWKKVFMSDGGRP